MKRKALGKGLSSLIPATPPPRITLKEADEDRNGTPGDDYLRIDIDKIRPNRRQPRRKFDKQGIENLSKSLINNGVMQPIAVRRLPGGRYEILAGERRWRAAQQAGLMKIPAVVHDLEDERLLEFALVENLMREDLNPIEESLAYKSLMDDFGMTQKQIAGRVGKRRATIANMLRLLSLSRSVRDRVEDGSLSMGHARALASLSSPQRQEELAAQIVARDLSVRQVESMVARMNAEGEIERRKGARRRDPNVEAAESKLQSLLGTRVRIVQGKKGGRLEIHYYGDEELQRIYNLVHDAAGGKS